MSEVEQQSPNPTSKNEMGFTQAEMEVLDLLGKAFNAFHALPKLHPSDLTEFVHYTHALQNMVIQRPGARLLYGVVDQSAIETGAQWGGVETLLAQRNAAYAALDAIRAKLAEYLERLLQGRTLPNRWVGEINEIVSAAITPAQETTTESGVTRPTGSEQSPANGSRQESTGDAGKAERGSPQRPGDSGEKAPIDLLTNSKGS